MNRFIAPLYLAAQRIKLSAKVAIKLAIAAYVGNPEFVSWLAQRRKEVLQKETKTNFSYIFLRSINVFSSSKISEKSSSLTYSFLLAVVPLLAIAFTLFKNFGGLQKFLDSVIAPLLFAHFQSSIALQINGIMNSFVQNLDTKTLSTVAFVTFLLTVINLLLTVESSLNDVFGVKRERALFTRFANYWVILSFSPVVVALSSRRLQEMMSNAAGLEILKNQQALLTFLQYCLSLGLQFAFLFIIYAFLNNRKFHYRALFMGTLIAVPAFELMKFVNVFLTSRTAADQDVASIYGSIPLIAVALFVWLRLVAMVVLLGGCVTLAAEETLSNHVRTKDNSFRDRKTASPTRALAEQALACAQLYDAVADHYFNLNRPVSLAQIGKLLNLSLEDALSSARLCLQSGILVNCSDNDSILLVVGNGSTSYTTNPELFLQHLLIENSAVATHSTVAKQLRVILPQLASRLARHPI